MPPSRQGTLLAIAAFSLWGFFPFYFKLLGEFSTLEVLANRIIWSVFALGLFITFLRQWRKIQKTLANYHYLRCLLLSTVLIGFNWCTYIWSVASDQIFEASLGYYINPLVNVLLGFIFLKERLRRVQWAAVALAAIGVFLQIINLGSLPWIALVLGFSFGFYGLIHKNLALDTMPGLFVETILLFPLALVFLLISIERDMGPLNWTGGDWLLLSAAGPVTVIPLLLFTAAAKRITYSSLGFLVYITPSILFLLAALVYREPFNTLMLITFGFIWAALIIFSVDAIRHQRHRKRVE
ncbi:MAG: chloramphenicol-sensitive protein RarD [Cellvibrionaceae bacterium]|jgi:chloramphenicol-sensitive protein RarD